MTSRLLTQLARRVPRRGQRALNTSASPTPASSQITEYATQRPSEYYSRPRDTKRDLPSSTSRTPLILAISALGLGAWGAFYAYATNAERLSNSVTLQILDTARADPGLRAVLGDAIRPAPAWWLNGDPWISGAINTLRGDVDVSFRLKGHKQSGTLYFTSVRKQKGEAFSILRFRVIADDGTVINIDPTS